MELCELGEGARADGSGVCREVFGRVVAWCPGGHHRRVSSGGDARAHCPGLTVGNGRSGYEQAATCACFACVQDAAEANECILQGSKRGLKARAGRFFS